MQFVIAGRSFIVEDLDPDMDKAFLCFHEAFLGNRPYNLADFEKEVIEFFNRAVGSVAMHDKFFNNFTIIWRWLWDNGRLNEAESLWEMAINFALSWERQNEGKYIHKGTPFYFWGMSAILRNNLDKGYSLMHQALEEDIRTSGTEFPNSPASAFATLNHTKVDQAFRPWLVLQIEFLNEFIKLYCSSFDKNLTLEEFQTRFLFGPPSKDAASLFAYTLARLFQLSKVPPHALASDFAGQLETNLLFDMTLVIDAAIKAKNPNTGQRKFIDHATFLSENCALGLSKDKLIEVNKAFKNNFDSTLKALLNDEFSFQDGSNPSPIGCKLTIAYGLRNHGAHNVSSAPTIWHRFENICQSMFDILFLCVDELY